MRLNKYLAQKNIASRREADDLIESGKVFVNGKKAVLGLQVEETDKVEVRGKGKDYRYFLYNKPVGIVTAAPQNGETGIEQVAKFPIKVFPVGRLDKDSSGLLIMTNDGRLTKKILDPENEHEKEYLVRVIPSFRKDFKSKMEHGVLVDKTQHKKGYTTKPCKVKLIDSQEFSIILTEGKNRQIRRMCDALGHTVTSLTRLRIGKLSLGKLKPGEWREVKGI